MFEENIAGPPDECTYQCNGRTAPRCWINPSGPRLPIVTRRVYARGKIGRTHPHPRTHPISPVGVEECEVDDDIALGSHFEEP